MTPSMATTTALQDHPRIVTLILDATAARDRVENMLSGRQGREAGRCVDLTKHADQRSILIDQRDHRLRLDRAVLDRVHNGLLDLGRRPSLRQY